MITRIRYEKTTKPGILKSVKYVHSKNNAVYSVEINLNDCTYRIKNVNSKRVYSGGDNINNLTVLKRNIKSHLSDLGVEFGVETRNV